MKYYIALQRFGKGCWYHSDKVGFQLNVIDSKIDPSKCRTGNKELKLLLGWTKSNGQCALLGGVLSWAVLIR